jgi:thiamine phosphate synthase YjbQ (UPF0047 family)
MVITKHIRLSTKGHGDIVDITPDVAEAVEKANLEHGIATVFVPGSTGALTTIEYEPGMLRDLSESCRSGSPETRQIIGNP